MKIIFTTVQGFKSVTEEEIGIEQNLLPLTDCESLEKLEEQLTTTPNLKIQLVRISGRDQVMS